MTRSTPSTRMPHLAKHIGRRVYWQVEKHGLDSGDVGTTDISPDIGIVGTPVIDPNTNTIYVVSKSKNGSGFHQRLHALSLIDGSEKFNGPQEIDFSSGGTNFDPLTQNQRAGLALVNGVLYIAYASHGDVPTLLRVDRRLQRFHPWLRSPCSMTIRVQVSAESGCPVAHLPRTPATICTLSLEMEFSTAVPNLATAF